MSRQLLLIAFHFPPIQGSSGVHRSLAFARYLPRHKWDVTVLTVHPRAYESAREDNLRLIPPATRVLRAQAWDTARHLSIRGRYPTWLALPDRWQSWIVPGLLAGLTHVRRLRPNAIMSSYPVGSAHVIGLLLKRLTGLPWIADFRDPMWHDNYPTDPLIRKSYRVTENLVFKWADRVVVTTPGTVTYYRSRYSTAYTDKLCLIPNGFDPEAFTDAGDLPSSERSMDRSKLTLVHSGVLYRSDRNPEPFLQALADLHSARQVSEQTLSVKLRASGHDEDYKELIERLGLTSIVQVLPPISYEGALNEMALADALLLFQAQSCNRQIPAKVYEYLYAERPVLGITDPCGDTGQLLQGLGIDGIAKLEDRDAIRRMLPRALEQVRSGKYTVPSRPDLQMLSREAGAAQLASLLDQIAAPSA
jgi:glycosyltransferase involved in cell wall biosynthesis